MSNGPAPDVGRVALLVASIEDQVTQRSPGQPGTVVSVQAATPPFRAALANGLSQRLERPVFRLAAEDLVAASAARMAAVLRLLDAAEVAGAVAMVDAADHLAQDAAAEVGLAERLASHRGLVVLVTDDPDRAGGLGDLFRDLADR